MTDKKKGTAPTVLPKPNPFLRNHDIGERALAQVGPPLQATIVERLEVALAQLSRIKRPGIEQSHARAGCVYVYLAYNASAKTGEVYKSVKTISQAVGCSPRQASGCLDILVALGLLTKRHGKPDRGHWPQNIYCLRKPITDGEELPAETQGGTDGKSPSSPSAIDGVAVGNPVPTNQEEQNRELRTGLSNQVAREREGEDDQGDQHDHPPQLEGEADGNGNGEEPEDPGSSSDGEGLPSAMNLSRLPPWDDYEDDSAEEVIAGIDAGEQEYTPAKYVELLDHVWRYEQTHLRRPLIIARLHEAHSALDSAQEVAA